MGEFKTVSLADQVFEKIENDIITGVYSRGEILTELKLAEDLGVSRTPIREAIRRLEHERLLAESGKGSVVLGITLEDLIDIMCVRERVEGLAACYVSKHITPESTEKLQSICELQDFYYQRHDIENLRRMDDQFHITIYELCGSNVIHDTLQPLHKKTQRYRRISIEDDERLAHSIGEHKAIAQAICAGDAERAEQLLHQHITNAKESMIKRFSL